MNHLRDLFPCRAHQYVNMGHQPGSTAWIQSGAAFASAATTTRPRITSTTAAPTSTKIYLLTLIYFHIIEESEDMEYSYKSFQKLRSYEIATMIQISETLPTWIRYLHNKTDTYTVQKIFLIRIRHWKIMRRLDNIGHLYAHTYTPNMQAASSQEVLVLNFHQMNQKRY